jgi:PASTA domain-containing protein
LTLPNLVGLQAGHARRIALGAGLEVQSIPQGRCHAVAIRQSPGPHQMIPFRQRKRITVTFRLRG